MSSIKKITFDDHNFHLSRRRRKKSFLKKISSSKGNRKLWLYISAAVFFLFILPVFYTAFAVYGFVSDAKKISHDLKKQDVVTANIDLESARNHLQRVKQGLTVLYYFHFLPPFNFYYNDVYHIVNAGVYGMDAAQTATSSIVPFADTLGLNGQTDTAAETTDQRIQLAVLALDKVTPHMDDISKNLSLAKVEMDQVNPDHYPSILGLSSVNKTLITAKSTLDTTATFLNEAKPLVKQLPYLLGEPTPQRYLVLFQNDKELRPTGGFITAYAIFSLDHGTIHVDTSQDIYKLDGSIAHHPVAARPILEYLPKVYTAYIRDANLSPDFYVSMHDQFLPLYKKSDGPQNINGIVALDTHVLLSFMHVLGGQITVSGDTFTTQNDPRCDCAQVIYQLESYAEQATNKNTRKGILGELLSAIMKEAFSSSSNKYWASLFNQTFAEINQKHMLFYMFNRSAQKGIEAMHAGGRIEQTGEDYLHINDTNFGSGKANLYIQEAVDQNYQVKSDNTIEKTVTINYSDPDKASNCSPGSLCLNTTYRDWLRIYVPQGSTLVSSSGSGVKIKRYDDLGKTVFEGFLMVRPLGSSTFTITYDLPFKKTDNNLSLLVQKQPGKDKNPYTISLNGNIKQSFNLTTDKMLQVNLSSSWF